MKQIKLDQADQTIADVLARAAELLRGGWSREHTAATKKGVICALDSPEAKQFSLAGALLRAEVDCNVHLKERGAATKYLSDELSKRELGGVVRFHQKATNGAVVVKCVKEARDEFIKKARARKRRAAQRAEQEW